MYVLGKKYKFQLEDRIFYTGTIVEEDNNNIRIDSIKGENIILAKGHIVRCTELRGTEDGYNS